jgi:hypothetical protein
MGKEDMKQTSTEVRTTPSTVYAAELRALAHPSWVAFMRFCREMGHGEIENLKIQDGLPQSAEMIRRKIRFTP